jgi:hypothetical protein
MRKAVVLAGSAVIAIGLLTWALGRSQGPAAGASLGEITWAVSKSSPGPRVGEEFTVSFSACCYPTPFGVAGMEIAQADPPVLEVIAEPVYPSVEWTLRALRPGSATLTVTGKFEKYSCYGPTATAVAATAIPTCVPLTFVYITSPELAITVTAEATPVPTPVPPMAGDADCDGAVTSKDAAVVLQYAAGFLAEVPCPENANVNGGELNAVDAVLILQFVAGLFPHFV